MIRVMWDGLDDLKSGLTALPADLVAGAIPLARAAAAGAAASIRAAYPHVTGELAGGVQVLEQPTGPYGVTISVVNLTWWAKVFDYGSKPRYTGRRGRKRMFRGAMPKRTPPVFAPRILSARQALESQLMALMRDKGLTVNAA